LCEEPQRATERNEPDADLADGAAVVLAEIGDRLVIGNIGQALVKSGTMMSSPG